MAAENPFSMFERFGVEPDAAGQLLLQNFGVSKWNDLNKKQKAVAFEMFAGGNGKGKNHYGGKLEGAIKPGRHKAPKSTRNRW